MAPTPRDRIEAVMRWMQQAASTADFLRAVQAAEWHDSLFARQSETSVGSRVKIRSSRDMGYPVGSVAAVERVERDDVEAGAGSYPQWVIETTFMGLLGPTGALPQVEISRILGSEAGPALIEIIESRFLRAYFDAVETHRPPWQLDRALREAARGAELFPAGLGQGGIDGMARCDPRLDRLESALWSLLGIGIDEIRSRLRVAPRFLLSFGGTYLGRQRSAAALEQSLAQLLGIPARVNSFAPRWRTVEETEWSRLGTRRTGDDSSADFCQLGHGALVGRRVLDGQGAFGIHVGPFPRLGDFLRCLPEGRWYAQVEQLVRVHVGPWLDFDLEFTLARSCIRRSRLRSRRGGRGYARLGRTAWIGSWGERPDFVRRVVRSGAATDTDPRTAGSRKYVKNREGRSK